MKLLICTQALDRNDSNLGFFVRWVAEFAKNCEQVSVVCLRAGKYELPPNVRVYPLGQGGKIVRVWRFWRRIGRLRSEYDAVFVHMNPEYVVLGGIPWHAWGKKIGLWYTHKSVDLKLRLAAHGADVIFTASPESFRLVTPKLQVMGHGIDTDFFTPDPGVVRGDWWLSAGRLSKSKRHDLVLRAAVQAGKELRIAGDGPERTHLENLVRELNARVTFLGPLTHTQLRDEYRRAALLVHRSETGSLDKVVLEAAACGLPVDTTDPALAALPLGVEYVRAHHSLSALIPRILARYDLPQ